MKNLAKLAMQNHESNKATFCINVNTSDMFNVMDMKYMM